MDSLEYVKSIDFGKATSPDSSNSLPTSTSPAKVKFVGGVRQAAVVSGSIVAFTDALTAQDVEDVTNGTLFAQLAATKKTIREDPILWYDEYVKVMENIGFGVKDFSLKEYKTEEMYLKLDRIAPDVLKPISSATEYILADNAISKLGSGETGPIKLLAAETMTSTRNANGNFQLVIVDKDSNGAVTILLGAYFFFAGVKSDRFLWDRWQKASLQLFYSGQKAALNETVYGKVRETIKEKVAPYLPEKVASIPL